MIFCIQLLIAGCKAVASLAVGFRIFGLPARHPFFPVIARCSIRFHDNSIFICHCLVQGQLRRICIRQTFFFSILLLIFEKGSFYMIFLHRDELQLRSFPDFHLHLICQISRRRLYLPENIIACRNPLPCHWRLSDGPFGSHCLFLVSLIQYRPVRRKFPFLFQIIPGRMCFQIITRNSFCWIER